MNTEKTVATTVRVVATLIKQKDLWYIIEVLMSQNFLCQWKKNRKL